MLTVIGRNGPSSIAVENVGLLNASETVSKGSITDMGNGDILVAVESVPEGEFVVILNGTDQVSKSGFQRQSTTQISVSKVNIRVSLLTSALFPVHRYRF